MLEKENRMKIYYYLTKSRDLWKKENNLNAILIYFFLLVITATTKKIFLYANVINVHHCALLIDKKKCCLNEFYIQEYIYKSLFFLIDIETR